MSKPNLGTIEYHPFSEIPDEFVSFPVDDDMRQTDPNDPSKKTSRRNRAKQLMGAEKFNKLKEQNKELELDNMEKRREKRMSVYRNQLAEIEKKELLKKQLEEKAKEMAEMEKLWLSESTTPHPISKKKPLLRWPWPKGGRRRRSTYKLKRRRISRK